MRLDSVNLEKITKYVQHPTPIKNIWLEKLIKSTQIPVLLTKDERRRIRKRRTELKNAEVREKQHLGLEKPPEPRITYKNFMRVLGSKAIQDPTKAEEIVQKAYRDRMARMLKDNESRKLSKQQKHEKIRKKFEKSLSKECQILLVRLSEFPSKKQLYKLRTNAKQLFLCGFVGGHENCKTKMIYVEGCELAISKFKKLITKRINWSIEVAKEGNDEFNSEKESILVKEISKGDKVKTEVKCDILWQGLSKAKIFKRFKPLRAKNENELRKFLHEKKLECFWSLVKNQNKENN